MAVLHVSSPKFFIHILYTHWSYIPRPSSFLNFTTLSIVWELLQMKESALLCNTVTAPYFIPIQFSCIAEHFVSDTFYVCPIKEDKFWNHTELAKLQFLVLWSSVMITIFQDLTPSSLVASYTMSEESTTSIFWVPLQVPLKHDCVAIRLQDVTSTMTA
jgi:hypothetical protein